MIDLLLRIKFENGWVLWFLLVVPLVLVWSLLLRRRAIGFSAVDRATRIQPGWRERMLWVPVVIRCVAIAAIIAAASRPQLGVGKERTVTKGVAIMMVLDRSWSMVGAEMEYRGETIDRLEGSKRVFKDFVLGNEENGGRLRGRNGDLIGLIGYSGFPETYCPLVREYEALVEAAETITPARTGTAIGDAIALAAARLKSAEEQLQRLDQLDGGGGDPDFEIASKVMIVLTDGEEGRDVVRPMSEAIGLAKEWGITVYTIDFGSYRPRLFGRSGVFESIAEMTGGQHFNIDDETSLEAVYAEIDALEPTEIERVEFASYREWYHVGALIALGLIAVDSLLNWVVLRRAV